MDMEIWEKQINESLREKIRSFEFKKFLLI